MFTLETTITREVDYAALEQLAAATEDEDLEVEVELNLEVEYSITGSYRPATWGYFGGAPEEHPELEIDTVTLLNEEDAAVEEITLTREEEKQIEEACWEHAIDLRNDY